MSAEIIALAFVGGVIVGGYVLAGFTVWLLWDTCP